MTEPVETPELEFRDEILALTAVLDRPGAVAFSLSYDWGCTARVFDE